MTNTQKSILAEKLWRAHVKRQYFHGATFSATNLDEERAAISNELALMAFYRERMNKKAFLYHYEKSKTLRTSTATSL